MFTLSCSLQPKLKPYEFFIAEDYRMKIFCLNFGKIPFELGNLFELGHLHYVKLYSRVYRDKDKGESSDRNDIH
ncbi:hypothetical protein GIB67_031299 [Kingdonia uniflora]|uniref:Uncharacterized protein n=1 Tax=Kingdonia uniflora TaxID=39325 RepID=A0A7J7P5Q2_9MAGN|nr:hypothetical protein GIB67_031299 [Kingdonia uniflora]